MRRRSVFVRCLYRSKTSKLYLAGFLREAPPGKSQERSLTDIEELVSFLEKFGAWGLFIHSFIDAIIFPIPAFFTQVSLSMVNPQSALWLATVGFIACLLGTPFGYWIGKSLGHALLYKLLKKEWIDSATALFQKNGETAILFGAFTPIPFKVFTILSGCLDFPLWRLIVYAALGRSVKFYVVGLLFYVYGRAAENMVHNVSMYVFAGAVPLAAIYLLIRRAIRNKRAAAAKPDAEAGEADPTNGDPAVPAAKPKISAFDPPKDRGHTFTD
jgi:membrane protein YqaA with SNARE-associated domain